VRDGDFFLMTNLRVIERTDLPLRFDAVCRFWDRAASEDGDGAYTAGALVAKKGDRFFLLDMIRKRLRSGAVENLIEQIVFVDEATYGKERLCTCFEVEPGSGGKRQAEITKSRLRGHRVFGVPSTSSKEARAEPLAIAIENGEVFVVNGAYVPELFEEMQGFPTGKFKDQTDAFAGAYLELVLPTSKAQMLTIAQGAGAQSIPEVFRSQEGKCRNRACERPAFEADGYCCDCCRRVAPQAEAPERHHPECNVKFNDWWVKRR
jgi:predicted phage terminase large subunit-like protein